MTGIRAFFPCARYNYTHKLFLIVMLRVFHPQNHEKACEYSLEIWIGLSDYLIVSKTIKDITSMC